MDTPPSSGTWAEIIRAAPALRLLVVEDHRELCAMLRLFLGVLGCEARFVPDVGSALRAAKEERFDALLSDIALPDGDGWDLLRQLAASGHRPRHAIAMSCHGLADDRAKSAAAGFAAHLAKPFAPDALARALRAAVPFHAEDAENRKSDDANGNHDAESVTFGV